MSNGKKPTKKSAPTATKKSAPKKNTTKTTSATKSDDADMRVIQVAQLLSMGYLKTRDAMLKGRFGPSKLDERGKLTVKRSAVEAFKRSLLTPA